MESALIIDKNLTAYLLLALAIYGIIRVARWYERRRYEQSSQIDDLYRHIEDNNRVLSLRIEDAERNLHRRIDDLVNTPSSSCGCGSKCN